MEKSPKAGGVPANVLRNRSVFVALFAALIAATCFVSIPVGMFGVPIVLQNMFALLAGAILGNVQGAAAVGLFIVAGALGLPVFSGGSGGFAVLTGPTSGYIAGYFLGSLVTGLMLGRPSVTEQMNARRWSKIALAGFAGFAIIYVSGAGRLAQILAQANSTSSFQMIIPAITAGVLPYLPGDVVKLALLIPLAAKLRPVAARYISWEDNDGHRGT